VVSVESANPINGVDYLQTVVANANAYAKGRLDLAGAGARSHPRGENNGRPEQVAFLLDRLSRAKPDANAQAFAFFFGFERPLQGYGRLDSSGDGRKGGHEAIAHRLDFRAAVLFQHISRDALVLPQHGAPVLVAKPLHHLRVAGDVGKEDGPQEPGSMTARAPRRTAP
jgi:hypothetical protein